MANENKIWDIDAGILASHTEESKTNISKKVDIKANWNEMLKKYKEEDGSFKPFDEKKKEGVIKIENTTFLCVKDPNTGLNVLFADGEFVSKAKVKDEIVEFCTSFSTKGKPFTSRELTAGLDNLVKANKTKEKILATQEAVKNYEKAFLAEVKKVGEVSLEEGKAKEEFNKYTNEKNAKAQTFEALIKEIENIDKDINAVSARLSNPEFNLSEEEKNDAFSKRESLKNEKIEKNKQLATTDYEIHLLDSNISDSEKALNAAIFASQNAEKQFEEWKQKNKKPNSEIAKEYYSLLSSDKKAAETFFADMEKDIDKQIEEINKNIDNCGDIAKVYKLVNEVSSQEKYKALYNYFINNAPTVKYIKNIETVDGKQGVVFVAPTISHSTKKINKTNIDSLDFNVFYVEGKTSEDILYALPENPEDFVKLGARKVRYAYSTAKYDKLALEVFESTNGSFDEEKGEFVYDSNKKTIVQVAVNDPDEIQQMKLDIRTTVNKEGSRDEKFWEADDKAYKKVLSSYKGTKQHRNKILKGVGIVLSIAAATAAGVIFATNAYKDREKAAETAQQENEKIQELIKEGDKSELAYEEGKVYGEAHPLTISYNRNGEAVVNVAEYENLIKSAPESQYNNVLQNYNDDLIRGAIFASTKETTTNLIADGVYVMNDQGNTYFDTIFAGAEGYLGQPEVIDSKDPTRLEEAKMGYNAACKELENNMSSSAVEKTELSQEEWVSVAEEAAGVDLLDESVKVQDNKAYAISEDKSTLYQFNKDSLNLSYEKSYTSAAEKLDFIKGIDLSDTYVSELKQEGKVKYAEYVEVDENYNYTEFTGAGVTYSGNFWNDNIAYAKSVLEKKGVYVNYGKDGKGYVANVDFVPKGSSAEAGDDGKSM